MLIKKNLMLLMFSFVLSLNSIAFGAGNVATVTDDNFESFIAQKIAVVDFYSETCPPCRQLKPIFAQVADHFQGKVAFGTVNVFNESDSVERTQISAMPTLVIFKDGEEFARHQGFMTPEKLIAFIESAGI